MRKVFALGFLLLALGLPARAQFPIELACPTGTGVAYAGEARNNVTQGIKQHFCLDNQGNLTIQPQQILQGGTGTGNIVSPLSMGFYVQGPNGEALIGNFVGLSGQSGVTGQNNQNQPPTTAAPYWAEAHSFVAASGLPTGVQCCFSGNGSEFWLYYMTTYAARVFINNPPSPPYTGRRYFVGMFTWNTGSALGNNGSNPFTTTGAAGLEANVPNRVMVAFRLDQVTVPGDATWHALVVQPGATPTFATNDCGVFPDNLPHTFQITLSNDLSQFFFYIDGNSCGSLPASSIIKIVPSTIGGNAQDNMISVFWAADNNNVAGQVGMGLLWMILGQRMQ